MSRPWGRSELQPCGTHAAWTRHKRNGEAPDEQCRQAHNEYQRSNRTGYAQTLKLARESALEELARRHASEYRGIYAAALREVAA